jgi:hypothetical protein
VAEQDDHQSDTAQGAAVTISQQGELSGDSSGFVKTHCMTCLAGWTRQTSKGGCIVICLLDRQRVMSNLTDCDRYEARETMQQKPRGRGGKKHEEADPYG